MPTGIYRIVNTLNGKFYIGSSKDTNFRFVEHVHRLRRNTHPNKHLQSSWNKYGEDAFALKLVEECSSKMLLEIEQKYLTRWIGHPRCYNVAVDATSPMKGRTSSRKTRKQQSLSHSLRDRTQQWKNRRTKISAAIKPKTRPVSTLARPGAGNGSAKLTESKVKKIRRLYSTGIYAMAKLAERFSVDKKTVLNVVHRNFWRHV